MNPKASNFLKIEGVMQNRQNQLKMHYFYTSTFNVILGDPVDPPIGRVFFSETLSNRSIFL